MSVLNLLGDKAHAPGQPQIAYATVSTLQPAPSTFTDPLFVVLDYDPDGAHKFENWPAVHGGTLPTLGADVLLIIDDNGSKRVAWWDGQYTAPVSVAVTGDLISSAATSRAGCLLCDGSSYLIATYPALSAAIRGTYGGADGSHFYVPDLRGRAPIGAGTGTAAGASAWTLGETPTSGAGGEESHTLSTGEMPSHNHGGATGGMSANDPHNHQSVSGGSDVPSSGSAWSQNNVASGSSFTVATLNAPLINSTTTGTATLAHTHSVSSQGGGGAHNTVQPVSVVNWFIKT